MATQASLYDKDFFAWTQEQAKLLKERALSKLDIEHLLDEVESMGNQNKTELKNRLSVLIMHLLKWQYQPEYRGNSWYMTIGNQRLEITDLIEDNPSLRHFLPEIFEKSYKKAVLKASIETRMHKNTFPESCEWNIMQVLDDEFFPN